MAGRLSIYHPPGIAPLRENPFGKDVANLELFRALARYGDFEAVDILSARPGDAAELRELLIGEHPSATEMTSGTILNTDLPTRAGVLLRGQPDLYELAWMRRRAGGDRAYSLLGLIHTLAPPFIRQIIANSHLGPTRPWDALICTSPSVRDATAKMLSDWGEFLAERTGGRPPPLPALPIVPLGVDAAAMRALADRPEVRARRRAELGLADDDVMVLWVGRLSFFEKAFPQPMFRALQRAAKLTGKTLHFVMAGWFPSEADRGRYENAARLTAPDVKVQFVNGNDRELLGELWASGDIFLSLVDNIQETFGITPIEAMAAGLPVVVSDWDGYRFTVRHDSEGFLIPTLLGPAGRFGPTMIARHVLEMESYQSYVGTVAQFTAVHVGRAAEALAELVRSPELRRRMGQAGRARAADTFDWPVVVAGYRALIAEMGAIRAAAPDTPTPLRSNPVKGDPYEAFTGFATRTAVLDMPLTVTPGITPQDVLDTSAVELDHAFGYWRAPLEDCAEVVRKLLGGEAATLRDVVLAFPQDRRRLVEMGVMWLAKHGFVDWPT